MESWSLAEGQFGSVAPAKKKKKAVASKRPLKPGKFDLKVKRSSAGLGLFAMQDIPKGACVIEYTGNLITQAQYEQSNSLYMFDVGKVWVIDGSPRWNTARYINHSCLPNCYVDQRGLRVFIVSKRAIKAGEELSYNYGKEYFDDLLKGKCRCPKCAPKMHSGRTKT
jgi:SET domain-containing protein